MDILSTFGVAGVVWVVAFVFIQISLVEFIKGFGQAVRRKLDRRAARLQGLPEPAPGDSTPWIEGMAVQVLSLCLGGILGALFLGEPAQRLGIPLDPPFAGAVLGVILGAVASGWVRHRQQQLRAAGRPDSDVLDDLWQAVTQLRQSAPVIVTSAQPELTPVNPDAPYRTPTPDELSRLTRTDLPAAFAEPPDLAPQR